MDHKLRLRIPKSCNGFYYVEIFETDGEYWRNLCTFYDAKDMNIALSMLNIKSIARSKVLDEKLAELKAAEEEFKRLKIREANAL